MNEYVDVTRTISTKFKEVIDLNTLKGKKVIGKNGEKIGSINTVFMHPKDKTLAGVYVNTGWFSTDKFIGIAYVETLNEEGAMLNINPVEDFVGKQVFDKEGTEVGRVTEVHKLGPSNELLSLTVSQSSGKDDVVFAEDKIDEIGEGIVLNVLHKLN